MIYITKCPLTLILNKMVTVIKCMKNGTLCDVYCEVPRISLSHSWTCMRNAGANNQQQQQQQNELGDSRQRFFLTISFSRFPSNCYWCVCALSSSIRHLYHAAIHSRPEKNSERISCICHFGVSSESSKLYIQVRRI